jgi:hypothetical protein
MIGGAASLLTRFRTGHAIRQRKKEALIFIVFFFCAASVRAQDEGTRGRTFWLVCNSWLCASSPGLEAAVSRSFLRS